MGETMMMGLRLNEGASDAVFAERFGKTIAQAFPEALAECVDYGLLEWADGRLRLTEQGRIVGNEAFRRFVAEAAAT
jgi:oxygen-independent coproporphyrinogen-3 oxidase